MADKGCGTCWYWSEGPKANNSGEFLGECRRNSPLPQGFPITCRDGWCGEFNTCGFMPPWPASQIPSVRPASALSNGNRE